MPRLWGRAWVLFALAGCGEKTPPTAASGTLVEDGDPSDGGARLPDAFRPPDEPNDIEAGVVAERPVPWLPGVACTTPGQGGARVILPSSLALSAPDSCGSFLRANVIAELEERATAVVADATDVYIATGTSYCARVYSCLPQPGAVHRVPRCGGPVETLPGTEKTYAELVDGGAVLYYRTAELIHGEGEVGRIGKTDGVLQVLEQLPDGPIYALAANSTHGYVMKGSGMYRVAHDSVSVELITTTTGEGCGVKALAVDDTVLSWSVDWTAYRAALDGTGATEIFISAQPISALAVTEEATYLGTRSYHDCASGTGRIVRAPVSGEPFQVLDAAYADPTAMRVHGEHVYWSDSRAGLVRVATDGSGGRERVLDGGSLEAISGDRIFVGGTGWRLEPLPASEPHDEASVDPPLRTIPVTGGFFVDRVVAGVSGEIFASGASDAGRALIAKYDSDGVEAWRMDLGPSEVSHRSACLAAGTAGAVVVASGDGYTASLRKFHGGGAIQWEQSFDVVLESCDVDGQGWVYASGRSSTEVPLAMQLDSTGNEIWRLPLASDFPNVGMLRADPEGILLTTYAPGSSLVYRLGRNGECVWQLPVDGATVWDLAPTEDGGGLLLGETWGSFALGGVMQRSPTPNKVISFAARLEPTGEVLWIRYMSGVSLGTFGIDYLSLTTPGLASSGGAYFVRGTPYSLLTADLSPSSATGIHPTNAFVARFEADATHSWTRQLMADTIAIATAPDGMLILTDGERIQTFRP
jgi:hypothetical protein